MPKYTINGVTYSSPTELSDADLEELAGGAPSTPSPASAPAAPQKRSTLDEIGRQIGLTARAGYEAFTSPATAVLEAGRGLYNLGAEALGSESRMPSFYGAQEKMLSNVLPTPENATERAVQAGTQAMASTAGMAKVAPNVPALAADLYKQIPVSAVSGLTAQPTAEIVKDVTGSDLAATIAGIGVGTLTAAGAGKTISAIEGGKKPLYTMEQVKQRASQAYNAMDEAGVTLKPDSVRSMISDVKFALDDARMVAGTDQANEINKRLTQINKMIGKNDVSFTSLDKMRSILNDLKSSKDNDIKRLAGVAVTKVDDYISNLSGTDVIAGKEGLDAAVSKVMTARKDWRNASRASILDDALNVAEAKALDPKASESELIRRGFINIAANKDKMKLFNKTEQNIIKSVAKGGTLDPLLTFASQFSPLRSKLAAAGGAYAFTQAPVATSVVAGGGLTADLLQGLLRSRAARQAVKQIASGAEAPAPNLGYRGLLSGALNPPQGNVTVQGISDEELQRLFTQ